MKKIANIIIVVMILILTGTISQAKTGAEIIFSSDLEKLYAENTVLFSMKLENFQEVKHGINAYKATLVYDKDIFEEVKESDFQLLNYWEGLQYNQETGEFVIYKKAGTTKEEEIAKISLKVKKEIKASVTEVKLIDMVISEGKEDITIEDNEQSKVEIDIIEEQEKPGENPGDKPGNKPGENPGDKPGNKPGENPGDKPGNKPEEKPGDKDDLAPGDLPQTGQNYLALFALLGVEVLLVVNIVYFGKKAFKSNKIKKMIILLLGIALTIQFFGTVYGAVSSFTQKGELNGDGAIDYADVTLLVSHLTHIKPLQKDKTEEEARKVLENADMNSDGTITLADLSILIQKIENRLNYEVTIRDLKVSKYYPNKEEEITFTFSADVNYGAEIKSITINGNEYTVKPNKTNENLYEITVNVGTISGVKEYKFEKATLTNEKTVKLENTIQIDVLKQMPEMKNWKVQEDIANGILHITFDIEDKDKAFISGVYKVEEKQEEIQKENKKDARDKQDTPSTKETNEQEEQENQVELPTGSVTVGNNQIELKVEEKKKYEISLCIEHNLDTDTLEQEEDNRGNQMLKEEVSLMVDYGFQLTNSKTYQYKDEKLTQSTEFGMGEFITVKFESTNKTTCVPKEVRINGKMYSLEKEKNSYTACVEGFEEAGNQEIAIEEVILSNGKVFTGEELEEAVTPKNRKLPVKIIKNIPTIARFRANEVITNQHIKANIYVKDENKTLTSLVIELLDKNNNKVTSQDLSQMLIEENLVKDTQDEQIANTYYLSATLDTSSLTMPELYQMKMIASYRLLEEDTHYHYTDKIIYEDELEPAPLVKIQKVETSKQHLEKGENVTLTYQIETNKPKKEITHIIVNNLRCQVTKHIDNDENVEYKVTIPVNEKAGMMNLNTTEFILENELSASVNHNTAVDVLKTKPSSEAFLQVDDVENGRVELTARIIDPDGAFISGEADLVRNSDNKVVATNTFDAQHFTFIIENVEIDTEYTLIAKMTYARDNEKEEEETNPYYVKDEIYRRRPIQLVADYELQVSNLKTYFAGKETKYLERGQKVTVKFDCHNKTRFYPVKAMINNKLYELTKQDDSYEVEIPVVSEWGPKTITIQKIILDNTKELEVTQNNQTQVGILKLRPTITEFSYIEDEASNSVQVAFRVNDTENTIEGGKIIVLDENNEVVKEEAFHSSSNGITFQKGLGDEYEIKVLADYDLDEDKITQGDNEYADQVLLQEVINVSTKRLFEIKDIVSISLYSQESNKEVTSITEKELTDLSKYIVKVRTKAMPVFYAKIKEYEIVQDTLNFILDYDNVIQYENGRKQNRLKVTYGKVEEGVAKNKSIETLIAEIEANPNGTFTLTQDYDASYLNKDAVITTTFRGTLQGNGYTIRNLKEPLFDTIENATIENLILEDVNLVGATSKGSVANTAQNATIRNVHVKGLNMTTGTDESAGMVGFLQAGSTIEACSVTGMHIKLSHIRVAAIAGKVIGSNIRNCYVEGRIESIISTKDGVGGIVGDVFEDTTTTIENCIAKIEFVNNTRAKNNGGILGLSRNNNAILNNNISLCTGTGVNKICGSNYNITSTNNYELEESELISNAYKEIVKPVSKADINKEFFINVAKFSEEIWELEGVSYEQLPKLKNSQITPSVIFLVQENSSLYIPEYDRIKTMPGFDTNKVITYHNLQKLMPYYDAKYLVIDSATISSTDILSTKVIKHVLPFAEGKLITYLTSKEYDQIDEIKVILEDNTVESYPVTFEELKQNIAIYKIKDTNLRYAFGNYVVQEEASIVETLTNYIKEVDYTQTLEPLTTAADSRLYKDHYNEVMKVQAQTIAMQLLQNDEESSLTINHVTLNSKIQKDLIDSGRIHKILYGYNYYDRWYGFEIGGAKVSDMILFENKMYQSEGNLDNLVKETLSGNITPNNTGGFYKSNMSKYIGHASLAQFLDNIIQNIGGYEDVNDWFTQYFGARNVLAEVCVDDRPDILYRGWYQLKKNERMILPVITLPSDSGYMIAGPAHLQFGAQQLYHKDPQTAAGRADVVKKVNSHVTLVKRHFTSLASSFDSEKWNRYCIMVYDCTRAITSYKTTYIPGTNIAIGTSPVYTQGKVGQQQPFFKNFSEVLGLWQPGGSSAGVGNTAGFLWFQATPGLTNYDTWTHEFEHALYDKIMLHQRGCRVQLETLTEGNVEQRVNWSENNLIQDVGPYYFNTSFYLDKEGNATQNLTPERINTKEKLENYYKGQQNALDLLDYIEGKAFIQLTPEQQAKIATRMNISAGWTSWGTITQAQAATMNLTSLEALYDNRIVLRPSKAWGVSVRGLNVINGIGTNDYGFESVWVNRWFIGHLDGGYADAFSTKRNFFEMLGYAGVEGYVTYGSKASANDLDAIKKITKMVTGTEMDWKQYKMSRYATVEENIENNRYIDVSFMIEKFKEALINDANKADRNISQRTNLRKLYYHYLKSVTNDFVADPLGTDLEMTHITTAEELIEKMNENPYGYYILENDIDFTGNTGIVSKTFMGKLEGNGHKIIGNTNSIFQKIKYGTVSNLAFEGTAIPKNITNIGVLAKQTQSSTIENISVTDLSINSAGRNEIALIGGAVSNVVYRNCQVEQKTYQIQNASDFSKLQEDPSGIFIITKDIDFTGYTPSGNSVVTSIFTGKIEGNGHTISNLNGASLFEQFNGNVTNLKIKDFNNTKTVDFVAAFANKSSNATFQNMKFENITIKGKNNVAVVVAVDNANSTFDKISLKNINVSGTGVYIAGVVGRKYGGTVSNIYAEGKVSFTAVANSGIIGSTETNVTITNVIANIELERTANSESSVRKQNAGVIGLPNSNTSRIKNSISLGNMKGYQEDMVPSKFIFADETLINTMLTKCYELIEATGISGVSEATAGHLDAIARSNLTTEFYKDLEFDETIWEFSTISSKGYPELK